MVIHMIGIITHVGATFPACNLLQAVVADLENVGMEGGMYIRLNVCVSAPTLLSLLYLPPISPSSPPAHLH